ncbi:two-component sensor kinase [Bifidobacterium sp. DSM 109960]|uniref:Sensor-like histidine kinase SenX3 n=1 Tax=Bifidobacterium erythrocebi TaxID=2675325 RepID=A0A7Y0EUI5_9BIFI|nr:HAMP domain-containing sensor histidine kinase [Bifidobacterium sp. DSM 109960]NMM96680.1 two-component sensor kinase [Bifidobacterium sp. DSM 109960]
MSDSPVPSLIVFAVFAIVGFCIVVLLGTMVLGWVEPLIERWLGGVSFTEWLDERLHKVRRKRAANDDDAGLDQSTFGLLSILQSASLVVGDDDEVINANPEAYRLGIMRDDHIVNDKVLDAVHDVREHGGRRLFDIQTTTVARFESSADPAERGEETGAYGVQRPNWLNVTVGRVDPSHVVVLLDDVSENVRFNQIRDSFIVNVSEQLLKPTEALNRLADELERNDLDSGRVHTAAHEVRVAGSHLNHMVADLLLLIKAQEPIVPSAANRINVMEQIDGVVASMKDAIREACLHVQVEGDRSLAINGDVSQIRTALSKLLENAIQYSPKGGYIGISAKPGEMGDDVQIRVLDQGMGIAKSEQSRIFERFYRGADQGDRKVDGVGLGLAIVKHVALTHHGAVSVWSVPGQGSTFTLTLPLAR